MKRIKEICGAGFVLGAFVFAVRAEAAAVSPQGYISMPVVLDQVSRPASTGRLSEAAESIAAALESGDSAGAEAMLSGLYSGAAVKASAAPVYKAERRPVPVPAAAAPVRSVVNKSALEDLGGGSGGASAGVPPPSEAGDDEEEASGSSYQKPPADETAPQKSVWDVFRGGAVGVLFFLLILCLI